MDFERELLSIINGGDNEESNDDEVVITNSQNKDSNDNQKEVTATNNEESNEDSYNITNDNQDAAAAIDEPINNTQQKKTNNISNKNKNITLIKQTNDKQVEIYEPHITRPILSIYEYVGVHTMLAKYIDAQSSIKQFIDDVEVNFTINTAELAFHLLKEGKWDAVIDRGYEKVTYSKLKHNKQWEDIIDRYFKQQREVYKNELFAPLGLKVNDK